MSIGSFATIQELRGCLARKECSAHELVDFYRKRFEQYNGSLGAALELFDTASVVRSAKETGLLAGIPGLVKDNICQQGRAATCASKILEGFRATYDATVIERLKSEGGLIIGRANMDEFAMGSSNETSAYGKAYNPWDLTRVPGGSSGGSAAAVAAGLVPWALGSDTGGSVRQPAAFCGIVGMKPTYGLLSRYGLIAYASSTDQVGPLTRTVYDNALLLSIMAGQDEKDSSSLPGGGYDYTKNLTGKLPEGVRIGIVDNAFNAQGMDPEVSQALDATVRQLEQLGATIKRIALPSMDYAAAAYFIISRAEAASNLARFDGVRYGLRATDASTLSDMYLKTRHDGFGDEVRLRIIVGNYVLSAGHAGQFYNNAQKVRRMIRKEFAQAFADVDVLLIPTHPAPAFKIGAFDQDKLQMDLQDYFTAAISLSGVPGMSVPCGMSSSGLPIGVQFVGNHGTEELLYRVAHAYEQNAPWHTYHPRSFDE